MKKVKLKSQISDKSIDELFDYQTSEKINQYFTIDNKRTFYKNNNFLDSKQLDPNETLNPIFLNNEFLFSIEKIEENNDQKYYFVSKSNFPSLKLSYHTYRLNSNVKERELPAWISLCNFNNEINEINDKNNIEQRKRKNRKYFLKNKKNSYELTVGDVIKLGRVSLIMTKIHLQKYKKNSSEGNNLDKKSNDKENKIKSNEVKKDIYQEYHSRALNNKINIDKNILKKLTINIKNDQTNGTNLNNNDNSLKEEAILIKEENIENKNDNKYSSEKNIRQQAEPDDNLTSKEKFDSDKKKLYKTDYNIELKEKFNFYKKINSNRENIEKVSQNKSNSEKKNICRICYCDEVEVNSPLLNICNCSGEIKYMHLNCLSHWLETKSKILNFSNNICKQIFFNKIFCEICKEKYPEIVFDLIKKKTYQVYKPEDIFSFLNNLYNNYIIFESFELINQKKIIYIISFDEKNAISLGRGQECDVRLGDVTVSRMHSLILRTKENKILIKDAGSKFGTLILLQAKKILINNKILSIQIGKLFLNLCVQYFNLNCLCKIFYFICCCIFCKKKNKKKEQKLDKKSTMNFSYNKSKSDLFNESNFNMVNINNYVNPMDINILDYNIFNMKNINIEDIIDIKFQIDETNIDTKKKFNHYFRNLLNVDRDIKKNISMVESFNNLNIAS